MPLKDDEQIAYVLKAWDFDTRKAYKIFCNISEVSLHLLQDKLSIVFLVCVF